MQSLRRWTAWARERSGNWPELPVLLGALTMAALAWLFIALAGRVASGQTQDFDQWVLDVLRSPQDRALPRGPLWLVDAARDVTALGSTIVLTLVVAVAAGYLLLARRAALALFLIAAVTSGVLLSSALKIGFDRPRPPDGSALQGTSTASFPSGHSFSSAVVYLTLGALLARRMPRSRLRVYLIVVALMLTLLVGGSRVYLGVHYPTDVLAGWAAGAGWALLWWLVARYFWPGEGAVSSSTE